MRGCHSTKTVLQTGFNEGVAHCIQLTMFIQSCHPLRSDMYSVEKFLV